jgi:diguanylate cyclase (GGDEF)-like protein
VASYSNLPPGDYVLNVRATNRLGTWSPQELAMNLHVMPSWWQTWTWRVAMLAMVAAAVATLMRLRTRVLRSRQEELERLVHDRTESLESVSMALQEKSAELEAASVIDPLTGLHNRRYLTERIDHDVSRVLRRIESHRQQGLPPPLDADLIFFVVDIDHFKDVNDQHGHAAGDAVLSQMRSRLQHVFRASDHLVRWGGEEFLAVARESSRHRAPALAERLRAVVADGAFVLDDGSSLHCSCSVGFACLPLDPLHAAAVDWHAVLHLADAALYLAKDSGRNAWAGIVAAQGESEPALKEWSRKPLTEWIKSGDLQMAASALR